MRYVVLCVYMFVPCKRKKKKLCWLTRSSTIKSTKSFTNNFTTRNCSTIYRVSSIYDWREMHVGWRVGECFGKESDKGHRPELLSERSCWLYWVFFLCFIGVLLRVELSLWSWKTLLSFNSEWVFNFLFFISEDFYVWGLL